MSFCKECAPKHKHFKNREDQIADNIRRQECYWDNGVFHCFCPIEQAKMVQNQDGDNLVMMSVQEHITHENLA